MGYYIHLEPNKHLFCSKKETTMKLEAILCQCFPDLTIEPGEKGKYQVLPIVQKAIDKAEKRTAGRSREIKSRYTYYELRSMSHALNIRRLKNEEEIMNYIDDNFNHGRKKIC